MYDVIVIGGGPAGLMASIAAAENKAKVLLIDKGDRLGRKLAISGGGRCNVTNRKSIDDLIKYIPGNGRFMYSPFAIFSNEDIIKFFEGLGIKLKEEDNGRMFPVTDKAKTVVDTLLRKVTDLGVEIRVNSPVKDLLYENGKVSAVLLKDNTILQTKAIIVAVGGVSSTHTGSTGDGYPWARKAGHTITDLFPTEVPITSNEAFIKNKQLQGLSLQNIALSVLDPKGKTIVRHEGDMIFTHFGISGPIALRCSQFVVKALKKFSMDKVEMTLDLFPQKSVEDVFQQLRDISQQSEKKSVKNSLKGFVADRLLLFYLEKAQIDGNMSIANVSNEAIRSLACLLKGFSFYVNGTLSLDKAFVTGGGVSVKEINPKTMESKLMKGLFFCGEVLDIHGYTGGFNITVAFSTGYTAGHSAVTGSY